MRNTRFCSLFYTIFLLLSIIFLSQVSADAVTYDISSYFPLVNTDTRTSTTGKTDHINGTRLLSGTTTMRYTFSDSSEEYYTMSSEGLKMYGLGGYVNGTWVEFLYAAPLNVAPLNISVGSTYNSSTTFVYAGYTFYVASIFKVEMLEDVVTGSGAIFKNTLRIKWDISITCPALGYSDSGYERLWLYPELGVLKQYVSKSGSTEITKTALSHYLSLRKKTELLAQADSQGYTYYTYLDENYNGRGYGRVIRKQRIDGAFAIPQYKGSTETLIALHIYDVAGVLLCKQTFYESGYIESETYRGADSLGNIYYEYLDGLGNIRVKTTSMGITFFYNENGAVVKILRPTRLTDNTYDDSMPVINNKGFIAWSSANTAVARVFLYNGATASALTDGSYNTSSPVINSTGCVAWAWCPEGTSGDIYFYNGELISKVTNDIHYDGRASINDNGCMVWEKETDAGVMNRDIYMYDGIQATQISYTTENDTYPKINNAGDIVWNSAGDIKYYDGSSIIRLTNDAYTDGDKGDIDINDTGETVWVKIKNGIQELMLYHDSEVINIASMYSIAHVKINFQGKIVWSGGISSGDDKEIFMYDGAGIVQITNNAYDDICPQINGNGAIVWQGYDGYDQEIFYYDGNTVGQLTYNAFNDELPCLNDKGDVTWQGSDGNDMEIFLLPAQKQAPVMLAADLNGNGKNEAIINFGVQYGIWAYHDDGLWTCLHTQAPSYMTAGNIDNDAGNMDDIVFDFGKEYGIWVYYNNSIWQKLHSLSSVSMITGDLDANGQDDILIDFGKEYGVWAFYNNSDWRLIHHISPRAMSTGNIDSDPRKELILDMGDSYGMWIYYNNSAWGKLHHSSSEFICVTDLDVSGQDDLIVDFGDVHGIWVYYNNLTWSKLYDKSPEAIIAGNIDLDSRKDLIVDFGKGAGIWILLNNASWQLLHGVNPDSIITVDKAGIGIDEIVIDFGAEYGVWKYYQGNWELLNSVSP